MKQAEPPGRFWHVCHKVVDLTPALHWSGAPDPVFVFAVVYRRFFRQAKDADYLKRTLLAGLPPLPQRCMEIRMVSNSLCCC